MKIIREEGENFPLKCGGKYKTVARITRNAPTKIKKEGNMTASGKTKVFKIVSFVAIGVILAITVAANAVLIIFSDFITSTLSTTSLDETQRVSGEALSLEIEEQGIVMVKNDDGDGNAVLPLSDQALAKVNVFGWSATQWIMGGSGSGRSIRSSNKSLMPEVGLLEALEQAGMEYNEELISMYRRFRSSRPFWTDGSLRSHDYEFSRVFEPAMSAYDTPLLNNARAFSDTALVVIGRVTGESNDVPKTLYKNADATGRPTASANVESDKTYLDISAEERGLLEYVGENYGNVVVIINSTNTMNLSFMRDIDGLDACLIVGGTGDKGARAIPDILRGYKMAANGEEEGATEEKVLISPSGKTVDTYAYDFTTNVSYVYSGKEGVSQYTNGGGLYPTTTTNPNVGGRNSSYPGVSYLDYAEGIYVGYKWYETADTEGFWSSDFARAQWGVNSYDQVVQYPFGYGLSYTEFEWKITDVSPASGSRIRANDSITVTVEVKNVGNYPGRDVVELYYAQPYTRGGIEKASVNLGAFAKTQTILQPGENEVLTLSMKVEDMASYDYLERKVPGGGYVLEEGNYVLTLKSDAHNVHPTVGEHANPITYRVDKEISGPTLNELMDAANIFTGEYAVDGFSVDGSDTNSNINYVTRSNFAGTFPAQKPAARAMTANLMSKNMYTPSDASAWENDRSATPARQTASGAATKIFANGSITELGLRLGDPANYDDDELWNRVLPYLTESEMRNLVLHAYIQEYALNSIGKPRTISVDGPSQIGSFNVANSGVGYPMPTVLAQTWNAELAKSFGLAVGSEAKRMNYSGWYAPGINIHRSPFGGRNFEYYSEDALLSGKMAAMAIRGALNVGVYAYAKHFIAYDQESYRDGLYCWMTEQTLREIYLKPFRIAIDEGGLTGVMTSYGRIGAVWSGGSEGLLTALLRDEWGFKGTVLTDYADHKDFMNADQMIRNGGDIWMDGVGSGGSFRSSYSTGSNAFNKQMELASKHVIYTFCNAAYERANYDPSTDTITYVKTTYTEETVRKGISGDWWKTVLIICDVAIVLGLAVWMFFAIRAKPKVAVPADGDKE